MSPQLRAQLAFINELAPLCRSELPYRVLWQVVRSANGISRAEEATLRDADKNTGRTLEQLEARGLIRSSRGGWRATRRGASIVRMLEKATDSPPTSVIEGRRLLAVSPNRAGRIHDVEHLFAGEQIDFLYADGQYELVAVLPDDHELARRLRKRIVELGHRVVTTRIVSAKP
jgi:hypothetical protein